MTGSSMRDAFPLPDLDWPPLRDFWAGAARHELVLPYRAAEGRWEWYPDPEEPDAYEWQQVSGQATLFSWSVVRHTFLPQYADLVPYVTGLAEIEEDPAVRLATMIVDAEPTDLVMDMPLEVTFRPLRFAGVDGEVQAPLFRPRAP